MSDPLYVQLGMTILGIETSCDETSAAVVRDGKVCSNIISSQYVHRKYGGVVPELASRAHQRLILQVVEEALRAADCPKDELDAVASTYGPGLVGALLVGLNFGKAMAYGLGIPFVGVNHMEGHLYSVLLHDPAPAFPFVSLIVSGGHTMLVHVEGPFRQHVMGQTRDDAAGEAFDKVAKMLGLGYPGGPRVDALAARGNPRAIQFPRSYLDPRTFDFSFSGIKTAVLYHLRKHGTPGDEQSLADLCASFQQSVIDVLVRKTMQAAESTGVKDITISGGVSANSGLRNALANVCTQRGLRLFTPRLEYCMDNGAMIAYVGWMKRVAGIASPLDLTAVAGLELA
jgi:N6-L-threonylcarbamoyladenine synthase